MPARYLLRFDDVCDSMDWGAWDRIESILQHFGVCPLLAVVPDNRDPSLAVNPPNPEFWSRVRQWHARGWTIGMHGHRHEYVSRDPGILGLNLFSEFAGLAYDEQLRKLASSLAIFRHHGVKPQVWIAPGHSFDCNTIKALASVGIHAISDGYALWPYCDAGGTFWLPQQLWRFRTMPAGVWTVCFHINGWSKAQTEMFEESLAMFRSQVVDFNNMRAEYGTRSCSLFDRAFNVGFRLMLQWRRRKTSFTTDHNSEAGR